MTLLIIHVQYFQVNVKSYIGVGKSAVTKDPSSKYKQAVSDVFLSISFSGSSVATCAVANVSVANVYHYISI